MKKIILIGAAVIVLLVVGVLVGVYFYVDTIAETAIERGGKYALEVDTTVDSVSVGLFSGDMRMERVVISNPEGFEDDFLTLNHGEAGVSLSSLMSDEVEVRHITLEGLVIRLHKKDGKANYQVLLDALKKFESKDKKQAEEGKKYVVRVITIRDITAHAKGFGPAGLGKVTDVTVKLPEIVLKDYPKNKNAATMAELNSVVIKSVLAAVVNNAAGLPVELTKDLAGNLSKLTDVAEQAGEVVAKVGDTVQEISNTAENMLKAGKGVVEGVDKAADDLKGIGEKFKGVFKKGDKGTE